MQEYNTCENCGREIEGFNCPHCGFFNYYPGLQGQLMEELWKRARMVEKEIEQERLQRTPVG